MIFALRPKVYPTLYGDPIQDFLSHKYSSSIYVEHHTTKTTSSLFKISYLLNKYHPKIFNFINIFTVYITCSRRLFTGIHRQLYLCEFLFAEDRIFSFSMAFLVIFFQDQKLQFSILIWTPFPITKSSKNSTVFLTLESGSEK